MTKTVRVINAGHEQGGRRFEIVVDRVEETSRPGFYVGLATYKRNGKTHVAAVTKDHDDAESAYHECIDTISVNY